MARSARPIVPRRGERGDKLPQTSTIWCVPLANLSDHVADWATAVWCWGWDGAGDLEGPDVEPIWEAMPNATLDPRVVRQYVFSCALLMTGAILTNLCAQRPVVQRLIEGYARVEGGLVPFTIIDNSTSRQLDWAHAPPFFLQHPDYEYQGQLPPRLEGPGRRARSRRSHRGLRDRKDRARGHGDASHESVAGEIGCEGCKPYGWAGRQAKDLEIRDRKSVV